MVTNSGEHTRKDVTFRTVLDTGLTFFHYTIILVAYYWRVLMCRLTARVALSSRESLGSSQRQHHTAGQILL